jgi:kynurenine 3-monooxygenase
LLNEVLLQDGAFTCTLFAPSAVFGKLELSPSVIPSFFDDHFPGVTSLINPQDLISQFQQNPHLPLINIKCKPYHCAASAVILGDAAHAMVPFYGQGMNAGLEDVRILFGILDKYERIQEAEASGSSGSTAALRETALAEYSAVRVADAHAINDLALQNYIEMRSSVLSPTYRLRKFLEESLSVYFPGLGWQTKYARVSFGNEPYSRVVAKSDYQGKVLVRGFLAAVGLPLLTGAALIYFKYRKVAHAGFPHLMHWIGRVLGS